MRTRRSPGADSNTSESIDNISGILLAIRNNDHCSTADDGAKLDRLTEKVQSKHTKSMFKHLAVNWIVIWK